MCRAPHDPGLTAAWPRTQIVLHELAAERVAAVAEQVNPQLRIEVFPTAMPNLVYPEVLPARTILATACGGEDSQRAVSTDVEQFDTISRSRFITFDSTGRTADAIAGDEAGDRAMRAECNWDRYRPTVVPGESATDSADVAMRPLLEDPEAWEARSRWAMAFSSAQGPASFAARLEQLITELVTPQR